MIIDFAGASYLGMRHPSKSLESWDRLSLGKPAALTEPEEHKRMAKAIARLQGCEDAVLARSTLHLIWDLFNIWSRSNVCLYVDNGVYQISRWGAELAESRGTPVIWFTHHDLGSLKRKIAAHAMLNKRPIVVTDGWCARCGRIPPIDQYLDVIRQKKGLLMIDDTQALGILGERGSKNYRPYGKGGGGTLRWFDLNDPKIVVVSSLAKAFGAPLAALSSGKKFIHQFKNKSKTRVHTSPPSTADIKAGEMALHINTLLGDSLRKYISDLIFCFRYLIGEAGINVKGGIFPVQLLSRRDGIDVIKLHSLLFQSGIETVLLREDLLHPLQIAFIINASHKQSQIELTVKTVKRLLHKVRIPIRNKARCIIKKGIYETGREEQAKDVWRESTGI